MPILTTHAVRAAPLALAVTLSLVAPLVSATPLTPGSSSASFTIEAFSSLRQADMPEVQNYAFLQDLGETVGASLTTVGNSVLSQAGGPNSVSAASGWAIAGAAGTVSATTAIAIPNGEQLLLNGSFARSAATASWWDSVLVTAPGVSAGSTGRLTAHLLVTGGTQAAVGPYFSRSYAAFSLNGIGLGPVAGAGLANGCLQISSAYCMVSSGGGYNNWEDGTRTWGSNVVSLSVPFVFGTPFELGFSLVAEAYSQAISFTGNQVLTQADGVSAFGGTVRWGGVDAIFRGSSPIADYTLISASGTDFRFAVASPVPEPSSAALMVTALGALAGLLGWRRRR